MLILKNNLLKWNNSYIEIVLLSDIHYGAHFHNVKLFKQAVNYVKHNDNCFAIGIGDWIDLVTYHSKGLVGDQKLKATEQYFGIVDLLKPIANKILFALSGNHEDRATRCGCANIMAQICDKLGIEYSGIDKHFGIKLPKGTVYMYAGHNAGGGGSAGAKLNKLHSLHNQAPYADIICGGHTHAITDDAIPIKFMSPYGQLCKKLQYYVVGGSMLESDEEYARKAFYKPQVTAFKILKISFKRGNDGMDKIRLITDTIIGDY